MQERERLYSGWHLEFKHYSGFLATYIGHKRSVALFKVVYIQRLTLYDKTALECIANVHAGVL